MSRTQSQLRRAILISGVSLIAVGTPVRAQDVAAKEASSPSSDYAATADNDIIVTAQRRSERLQDVPISIQALSASSLADQSISSIRDLTLAVPGFNMSTKGAFVLPTLRGISSQGTGAGVDPAIPIYLDGVYQANSVASIFELADVSGVEVLKGPQGTLYGRNATGGAILITSRKPSFDFAGNASASYGSYEDRRLSGFVTGGLVPDLLAFSVSADYHVRDGYIHDLINGGKCFTLKGNTVRGKLLMTPSSNLEITLSGMHTFLDDASQLSGVPFGGNSLSKRVAPTLAVTTIPFTMAENLLPVLKTRSDQVGLNIVLDTSIGQFTSVSAYQNSLANVVADGDGGPGAGLGYTYDLPSKAYSHETSFASKRFGTFSLIAGGLYFKQDASGHLVANGASDVLGTQHIEAYAFYGELTAKPIAGLTLIAGLRYSHEHRDYVGQFAIVPGPLATVAAGSKSWRDVTPRLTAQYQVTRFLTTYLTYNEAFKSGVFSPSGLSSIPVSPEKGRAYELGAKYAHGDLRLNVAVFKYKFSDLQVATTITRPDGTLTSVLQNAAGANIKGFDVDGQVALFSGFTLSGGFSYVDGTYTDFASATVNAPIPAATCPAGTFPCGNRSVAVDASGNAIVRSPRFSGNLTASYSTAAFGGKIVGSATLYHSASFPWEVSGRLVQKAYDTLAATLRWQSQGGLEVSVFGRNLTDRKYGNNLSDSAGGDLINYAMPRTFGVKIGYSF